MKRKRTSIMQRLGAFAFALIMAFATLLPGVTAKATDVEDGEPTINYDANGTLTLYKYEGDDTSTPLAGVVFSYLKVGSVAQGVGYDEEEEDSFITIGYSIDNEELFQMLDETGVTLVTAFEDQGTTYYTPSSLDEALGKLSQNSMETFMSSDDNEDDVVAMPATDSDGRTEAEGLEVGLYLVVETGYPATVTTTTSPFFVSIPMTEYDEESETYYWNYDVVAYPKNSTGTITIEKSVVEDGDETKYIDGEIGQDKEFVVRADVPGAIGNMAKYTITDTLSTGLTFQSDIEPVVRAIEADGKTTTTLVKGTHYTFSQDGQILTFDFITTAMGNGSVANYVQVEIIYYAYLNENAVVGSTGNENEVVLEYSTTTGEGSATTTVNADKPAIYTYAIDLLKYGNGDDTNVLDGVEFELYRNSYEEANKITVAYDEDGKFYYVIGENEDAQETTLTTGEDGTLVIHGLEAGTYLLVETETYDGYNLLADPIEIKITSNEGTYYEDEDGTFAQFEAGYTYYTDSTLTTQIILPDGVEDEDWVNFGTSTVYKSRDEVTPEKVTMSLPETLKWSASVGGDDATMGENSGVISMGVNNSSGFQLPSTGGTGTILFMVVGGILIIAAVALLYKTSRKKGTEIDPE